MVFCHFNEITELATLYTFYSVVFLAATYTKK